MSKRNPEIFLKDILKSIQKIQIEDILKELNKK